MDVFAAPVLDENAAPVELRGGKAFASAARAFGTPAAKQAQPGEAGRRALGDISNKGGGLTGPGKLGAAATPRRALGDITNAAPPPGTAATAAAKPSACTALPGACSARTAAFLTEAMLAQAEVWAAEGTEALAGPSGAAQQADEAQRDIARAQARVARMMASGASLAAELPGGASEPFADQDLFSSLDDAAGVHHVHSDDEGGAAPVDAGDITFDFGMGIPAGDDCDAGFWGLDDCSSGGHDNDASCT